MNKSVKARELKAQFANIPDDADVSFGPAEVDNLGTLTIARVKQRGDNFYNVEFNEPFILLADPSYPGPDDPS